MKRSTLLAVAFSATVLAACARPFHQRFAAPHAVDFASILAYAELSNAAYEDDAAVEAAARAHGYGDVVARTLVTGGNRYVLATDHENRRHLIAVRGTANIKNVKIDVEFEKAKDPTLGIRVHRGFRKAAKHVFDQVAPEMNKDYAVTLTGHSLGGAQAVVLGMYFHATGWDVSEIVTFGQPKVTDKRGARKYAGLPVLRAVNINDPVAMVPPRELRYLFNPYRHLGDETLLLDGPYYSFLEDGNESDPRGTAFWKSADSLEAVVDTLPQHSMDTYLARLLPKLEAATEVPYKDRLNHFTTPH